MPVAVVHVPDKGDVDPGGADGAGTQVHTLDQTMRRPSFGPAVGLDSPEMVEDGLLQVAVSIAMPCPHRPRLLTTGSIKSGETTSWIYEYAIGLLDVPSRKPASGLEGC